MQLNFVEKKFNDYLENQDKFLRTGCILIDLVVGGGCGLGFPVGKIINIVGDRSSGKTFLANEIIAKNYHLQKKLKWNYDDCESGYTFDNASELYDFKIVNDNSVSSITVEQLDYNFKKFLDSIEKDEIGIYVIDSLDGLSNDEIEERSEKRHKAIEQGKEFKEGSYQMKTQKFLSQEFFRTKADDLDKKKALFIILSQVRQNIDPFSFKKFNRSGGKALDHYCHTVLWLANVTKIKKKNKVVGLILKAKTEKSKTARPFRECIFSLYFDYGIDNIGSNLDFLFDLRGKNGLLLKESDNICWSGKQKNIKNYKEFLKENNLYEKLRDIKKEETGKISLDVSWIEQYLEKDEDLKKGFNDYFGETLTRDELILKIEQDSRMEQELERRVIQKWEEIEESISTNRKKY